MTSSSVVLKIFLPIMGSTSAYETRASDVGEDTSGSMFLNRMNGALGWRSAEERKVWSWRKKDTRFNGEPELNEYMLKCRNGV
jgi:hypothetical protein